MQKIKNWTCRSLFLIGLFVLCSSQLSAQHKMITGIVKDSKAEPIIGATVKVKGTSIVSATDLNGKFTINVPSNSKTLIISYVGMTTKEVPITDNKLDISLEDNLKSLNEVVVIGYGTVRKANLTGSVSSISGKALQDIPVTGTAEALTGRIPGVQITTADGSPDAEMIVRVRGGGSITGDNTPLYIVDGFPASNINDISPTDIQSIDVLKDASTTAIYGSRGANGVVIITTKSAKGGKTQVSYNGFIQTKKLSKRLAVLDPYEYVKLNYEYAALQGADAISSFQQNFGVLDDLELYKYQKGHDWQNDMFGSSVVSQQQNITLTGGNEKTKFSLSTTYNFDGGLMQNNNYNRFTTNFKLFHEISKNLVANFNFRLADTEVNGSGSSGGTYKIRTSQAVTSPAVKGLSGMTTVDPTLMTSDEYDQWVRSNLSLTQQAAQYWKQRNEDIFNFTGSLEWKILKNLSYRIEGGYEFGFNQNKDYWGQYTTNASYVDGNPLVDWTKTNSTRLRLANIVTYNTSFGSDNKLNILVGQETNSYSYNNNYMYATGFGTDLTPEKIFANIALGGPTKNLTSYVSVPDNKLSFFGRAEYNFKDRYLLTATFRADGSSKFAPVNQWGYFPALSGAWRIIEEPFIVNLKDWLSDLKLRAGYGVAGNDRIGSTQFKKTYSINASKTYGLGDIQNNYWATSNSELPNVKLKWETTFTQNIALDFGLFNERINGTVEYYQNTTKDLLIKIPIVAPGYSSTMMNVGQTSNKGVEVTLNGDIIRTKNVSLSGTFNIGINKSNVDKLANGITYQEYSSGWAGTDLKGYYDYHVQVGQPVGLIYGWVSDGYYTTNDFSSYDPTTKKYILKPGVPNIGMLGGVIGVRPGTAKYKDLNGDGVVNDDDRTIIGKTAPAFTGGFGFNSKIYNFDISVFFNYVYGNKIYNANKIVSSQSYRTTNSNLLAYMSQNNRYTYLAADGTIVTDLATLAQMNEGANAKEYWSPFSFGNATVLPSSWAVEDGSFLRLQNLTFGYTVPQNITRKFSCTQLRFYCNLNNLWILTNYSGYDPEVSTPIRGSSTSGLTPGVDYSSYPKSFSWTFGINLTF